MSRRIYNTPSRGAALLIFTLLFLVASSILVYGIGRSVFHSVVTYRTLESSKISYWAGEAAVEDAIYRHKQGLSYSNNETLVLGDATVSVTRTFEIDRFVFDIIAEAFDAYRKSYLELVLGEGASFAYGLQSDVGGILMLNSSSVLGNIYSNGSVTGTGSGMGNVVAGSVISAGPSGYLEGIHATGSAWAQTIVDTNVDGNAYCNTIDQSSVLGELWCNTVTATTPNPADYAGTPYYATTSLPIRDDQIEVWKTDAASTTIIASTSPQCAGGTWVIDTSTTTGPAKIECDVSVEKNGTVWLLQGSIWIEGNFTTRTGVPIIQVDPSVPELEGKSIPIIVDEETNRTTSSKITLRNSSVFDGYGDSSFILLISQNNDEELGGGEYAISSQQSANGDLLLYAGHGRIIIEQSGSFVGISGRMIELRNSAQIVYKTGAISLDFPSGPGGGFIVGTWEEVP